MLYMAKKETIEPPMNYLLINIPFLSAAKLRIVVVIVDLPINIPFLSAAKLRIVVVIVDLPINIPFLRVASCSGRHKGRGEA